MSNTARGVSLIELLVAIGLLALIMTLLVQALLPGLSLWKHARAVADIEQQCMVAEERITRTVLASIASSIGSASDANRSAISMLGHGGSEAVAGYNTTTGEPEWKQVEVFYFRKNDGVLYQSFWNKAAGPALPYDFADAPFALTPTELLALVGATGQQERRLADRVTELSLTPAPAPGSVGESETFVLRLGLRVDVPRGERAITREVRVVPRLRERK